jgi:SIR2-like domain
MTRIEEDRMVGGRDARETNQEQGYDSVYSKRDGLIMQLKSALPQKIVLFLGAGVSMSYGIPMWDALLEKLYREQFNIPDGEGDAHWVDIKNNFLKGKIGDVLQQCRMIDNEATKKGESFEGKVKDAIYGDKFNLRPDGNTTLSLLLLHFFPKPHRLRFIDSIVTFNFDSILESKLPEIGVGVVPVSKIEDFEKIKTNLPIYHVHGYLPQKDIGSPIIFSEIAYHTTYSEPYSWSNLVQISKLTNYTCLFVGVSLNDPNMRRLIDSCQKINSHQHFLITQKANRFIEDKDTGDIKELFDEPTQKTIDGSFAQYAKSLGVNIIFVDDYGDDLNKVLSKITN